MYSAIIKMLMRDLSAFPIGHRSSSSAPVDPSDCPLPSSPGEHSPSIPSWSENSTSSDMLSPPAMINGSNPTAQDVRSPAATISKPAPRRLSKPPPSNYRARPPVPLRLEQSSTFGMPKLPLAGASSMPSSPQIDFIPPQGRLQAAKSIPNLRNKTSELDTMPRPSMSSSRRSRRTRRSSTSSRTSSNEDGDGFSYHADILGDYGVELSPNWDPSQYPKGLPTPGSYFGTATPSPSTAAYSINYPTTSASSDGALSPRFPSERVHAQPFVQNSESSASASPTTSHDTSPSAATTAATSPTSPSRPLSLRHKLSISAMRNNAAAARRRQDSMAAERERAASRARMREPQSPTEETVEVDDMEFTLVKPEILRNGSPIPGGRDSPDPTIQSSDAMREKTSRRHESIQSRSRTPSASQSQTLYPRSPGPMSPSPSSPTSPLTPLLSPFSSTFPASIDSRTSVTTSDMSHVVGRPGAMSTDSMIASANAESYRQLELKWISTMSAVPSAEAGKSKKIRKLVIDGIPASVRGVVWCVLLHNVMLCTHVKLTTPRI